MYRFVKFISENTFSIVEVSMFLSSSIKTCLEYKEGIAKCHNHNLCRRNAYQLAVSCFFKKWNRFHDRIDIMCYPSGSFTSVQCKCKQNLNHIMLVFVFEQTYFQVPVIFLLLPVIVLSVFALLTIRNIHTMRQTGNRLERQMTRVLLSQTIFTSFCAVPIAIDTM